MKDSGSARRCPRGYLVQYTSRLRLGNPVGRVPEDVWADFINAVKPELRHDAVHLSLENLERTVGTRFASGSRAVQCGPSGHDHICPDRDGLHDIRTASRTTVDNDLETVAYGSANLRHQLEGSRRAIQVAAAVVRQDDSVQTVIGGDHCVFQTLQPFNQHVARPDVADTLDVVPALRVGLG